VAAPATPGSGRFITFEGGEGAGKSTQIRAVAAALRECGLPVIETREPGGPPGAERIRGLLLDPQSDFEPVTEALLFAAARRDHVQRTVLPALARGEVVLCDRFADSTRAYQGAAGHVPAATIEALIAIATDGLTPDLTVILDLDPAEGLTRAALRRGGGQSDRFEGEALAFHRRISAAFRAIAMADPGRCVLIDAGAPMTLVTAAILDALRSRLHIPLP
jgi:dTMP kinase